MSEPTYLIYEIQNTINGKIYRGAHYGTPDDGYMGSGNLIKRAIKKYGIDNFTKTILCECDSVESMYDKERELVDETFVARKDTYNLHQGGSGGDTEYLKGRPQTQKHKDALKASWTTERRANHGARRRGIPWTQERREANDAYWTPERRAANGAASSLRKQSPETIEKLRLLNLGNKHTDDVRNRMSEIAKSRFQDPVKYNIYLAARHPNSTKFRAVL